MSVFSFNKTTLPQAEHLSNGEQAEVLAEIFLKQQGLTTIDKNFRSKGGEIDRVMLDSKTVVFVEVRLRQHHQVGAAESVNIHKQRKIINAAKLFLLKHKQYQNVPCRFDVIALDSLELNRIDWIKDAFQVQE